MKTIVVFLLAIPCLPVSVYSNTWMRFYGKPEDIDEGRCIQQVSDGGYIIGGQRIAAGTKSIWLLKVDPEGNVQWERLFDGFERISFVRQTADCGYIITASTNNCSLILLKTDSFGSPVWEKKISTGITYGHCVWETSDKGFILAAGIYGYNSRLWLIKTNSLGDTIWTKNYGDSLPYYGLSVRELRTGGYIIAGYREVYSSVIDSLGDTTLAMHSDLWLLRTDRSGDSIWSQTSGGLKDDRGFWVEETIGGEFIVAGYTESFGSGGKDAMLAKVSRSGKLLWLQTYGDKVDDKATSLCLTEDGGFVFCGSFDPPDGRRSAVWLVKTDYNGRMQWEKTWGGPIAQDWRYGYCIDKTTDGGYIITSDFYSPKTYISDLLLIKTDSLGNAAVEERCEKKQYLFIPCSVGSQILLRYEGSLQGFHASIFDASGRKVDELHSAGSEGALTWGGDFGPGVYFIKAGPGDARKAQKVVLVH